jgi:hypothetical protein
MFIGDSFLGFIVSILLVAAGYQTWKAVEGNNSDAKKHWLTFWMLYGVFQFLELFLDVLLCWMPFFYNEAKLGFYVYLAFFDGASKIYDLVGEKGFKHAEDNVKQVHKKLMTNDQYKQLSEKIQNYTKSA